MGELIHTPGPWKWEDKTDGNPQYELRPQVIMGSNENVVFVSGADAKLIAAAPDLLDALIRLRNDAYNSCADSSINESLDIADFAIAKATNG